nr:hypothetical protein [Tanacetum cinerariifolium]GFA33420.1 hypothetical protein [Tanacetum cinerariifolium]
MVIAIPNLEDEECMYKTITIEYKWTLLRCANCKSFGHDSEYFLKMVHTKRVKLWEIHYAGTKVNQINAGNSGKKPANDFNMGSKFQFKSTKQVYRLVSKKNVATNSGTKNNTETPSQEASCLNPFNALRMEVESGGRTYKSIGKMIMMITRMIIRHGVMGLDTNEESLGDKFGIGFGAKRRRIRGEDIMAVANNVLVAGCKAKKRLMLLRPQHAGFGKPKTVVHQILIRNILTLMHEKEYKEKGVIDGGCSRHMTRNKCYLTDYEDYDGGFVSFRDGKGRISRK